MKLAVDGMGGDYAPGAVVQGAAAAARALGVEILLVGPEEPLKAELDRCHSPLGIKIVHCEEFVAMDDPPLKALRAKRGATIRVALELVRRGEAQAVVSAGNSGAVSAAAVLLLGKISGVDRPGIAGLLYVGRRPVILMDVGANLDCRPAHLAQFGTMAHAFAVSCLALKDPQVGLLSVGQEVGKGNELVRAAYPLLQASGLPFAGHVEGRDIFEGRVPIIICDGFVGNVALKLCEGMGAFVRRNLEAGLGGRLWGRVLLQVGQKVFARLDRRLDYEEVGGAPLLGVKGVVIVCHGQSSARAIFNGIRLARDLVQKKLVARMTARLSASAGGQSGDSDLTRL